MTEAAKRYRKKPVVIQAWQLTDCPREDWPEFVSNYRGVNGLGGEVRVRGPDADGRLIIPTLEGDHIANVGDWIIEGIAGELYPCKSDIFAATYEEVS